MTMKTEHSKICEKQLNQCPERKLLFQISVRKKIWVKLSELNKLEFFLKGTISLKVKEEKL